jgi:uncharacterized iron-regulated membrane protein
VISAEQQPARQPRCVLDARMRSYPERVVQFVSQADDRRPLVRHADAHRRRPRTTSSRSPSMRAPAMLAQPKTDTGFMYVMFKLHVDLFAGLPGKLFLGFMGLLLLVAIVSGVVLYSPFMRKLDFGTVRRERTRG